MNFYTFYFINLNLVYFYKIYIYQTIYVIDIFILMYFWNITSIFILDIFK